MTNSTRTNKTTRAPRRKSTAGSARKGRRSSRKTGSVWRKLLKYLLLAGVLIGTLWVVWVDYQVRRDFKALQWALPARIYARPVDLYEGAHLAAAELQDYLQRLGYRETPRVSGPGEFNISGQQLRVHTRGFEFWDGMEPSASLQIGFSGRRVTALRDAQDGIIPLARLEPVEIAQINPETGEDRLPVTLDEIPPELLQAVIAVEDRRFYNHYGVDVRGIARALWTNVRAGEVVQGGSTLTQQLVKNLYLTRDQTLRRKIEEAVMAVLLEIHFSKDEILVGYMNEVHLGQQGNRAIHGFALAAQFYFGRPLAELSLAELATLAGLSRGASYYNPLRYPERATERRNVVLARMHDQQFISDEQREQAQAATLQVRAQPTARASYPAFMDLVYADLAQDYDAAALSTTGLRIFTTLDVTMQNAMEAVLETSLSDVERRAQLVVPEGKERLEAAAVITNASTGEIRAVAGSRQRGYTSFNRALRAQRQIGSLVKPAVFLAALESGQFHLASVLFDRPVKIPTGNGDIWEPRNFEDRMYGDVYLYDALERSMNLATVDLGMQTGLERVADVLGRLGFDRTVQQYPSLLLGAISMSPLEVAQLYQTLASNGFRSELRAVEAVTTSDGEPLLRYGMTTAQAIDPTSVYLLEYAMQGTFERGTARAMKDSLASHLPLAGKTGTTNDLRDSWFAGYGDDLVGVVWLGHDDNRETGLTGASGALRVWTDIMRALDIQPRQSVAPPTIESHRVALQAVRNEAARDCSQTHTLPFASSQRPSAAVSCETGASLFERVIDRFNNRR